MKIAVVTDSNSGINQEEAKKLGVFVIPMPFMVDNKEYLEDITLTQDQFYEMLENNCKVVTSQPSPENIMNLWDKLLEEYDQIIHIPMSSGLSGSCQTAMMLAEDYEDKVFVVDNQRISITMRNSVIDAMNLIKEGKTGEEIREILLKTKFESTIYITVGTLEYLKRGGRITPAAAMIGTLLKIKPVLAIHGEKLDAHSKVRTITQSKSVMINAIKNDMKNLIKDEDPTHYNWGVAYSKSDTEAIKFAKEISEEFGGVEVQIDPLSLSVSCHIGPESLAVTISKKL